MNNEELKVWKGYVALLDSFESFSGLVAVIITEKRDISDLVKLNKMIAYKDIAITSLERVGEILEKVIPMSENHGLRPSRRKRFN